MRRTRRTALPAALVAVLALGTLQPAFATHFRYTHISWALVSGTTVEFSVQSSFRRSKTPSFNPCVNPATNTVVTCSGPGGLPAINDVIREDIGDTRFYFGDNTPSVGSGSSGGLFYLVTAIDSANDWLFARAIDPSSLPTIKTTIRHTYAAPGTYFAGIDDCCRISAAAAPNAHINNPDGDYKIETRVSVGTDNASATTALPPIITCPQNGVCTFLVPATDPDGDTLTFRLATASEADGGSFKQPGPPNAPTGASIDASSGVFTWNTTGATLGPVNYNTLYSTQVIIEERDPSNNVKGRVAVDFFIQLVPDVNDPPQFTEPVCNSTVVLQTGVPTTFAVTAIDPDAGDVVTLNVAGLPGTATMTPQLPTQGNPVTSTFSWTPIIAEAGSYVMTFSATDQASQQALCPVTLVVQSQCGDGDVDPGEQCDPGPDVAGDCCSASCQFETNGTTCGAMPVCGGPNTCQAGACVPGAGGLDTDGDGVIDCLDNCPLLANPDQADLDGDGQGDLCDPDDNTNGPPVVVVNRLRLRGGSTGSVIGRGSLVLDKPGTDPTVANGIRFTVRDRLETDVTNLWLNCVQTASPLRIKCISADKFAKAEIRAVPKAPQAMRWYLRLKRRPLQAPFKEPLSVTLTYGNGLDWVGLIHDCAAVGSSIVCKEP